MPILTNSEIKDLVQAGGLISDTDPACFQPCSYDMRIGSVFRDGQVIDAAHERRNEQISLAPGEVITMTTLEELTLPADIAGTAYAINSQSSEGLLVLNTGHVDPGYKGTLTVMAVNMRRVPYVVSRKDKIFTVVFERLAQPANPPYANGPGSRSDKERDLNKKVVEKGAPSLSALIALNAPFTRPSDVDQQIKKHWATIVTFLLSGIAALASVVAAIFAVASLLRGPIPQVTFQPPEVGSNALVAPAAKSPEFEPSQPAKPSDASPANKVTPPAGQSPNASTEKGTND